MQVTTLASNPRGAKDCSTALTAPVPPEQVGPLPIGLYGLGYVVAIAVMLWVSQGEARWRGLGGVAFCWGARGFAWPDR